MADVEDNAAKELVLWLGINNGGSREARRRFVVESEAIIDELIVLLATGASEDGHPPVDASWFLGDLPGAPDSSFLGVLRIFHALVSGVQVLSAAGNTYAAAALVRQLVEVEYLFWAFAEDHGEAANWRTSSKDDRRARWTPAELRKRSRGRFRAVDYQHHCEAGGHPTPAGFELFRPRATGMVWWEAAVHLRSALRYALQALGTTAGIVPDEVLEELGDRFEAAAKTWEKEDMLTGLAMTGVLAELSAARRTR